MFFFDEKIMDQMIYVDNAATTKLDDSALEAMLPWLKEEYGNPSQPYSFSRKVRQAIKEARETIASCINASPDEIYFTSGGTESDNWAIKSIGDDSAEKIIVTSVIEHHAVLNACKRMQTRGNYVEYLAVDKEGVVSPQNLALALNAVKKRSQALNKTILVSIMMANNEIGTVEPIRELVEVAHSQGAFFHTDAVQALGHLPVDVKKLDVDVLSASAHKFNGPKGVGFLYVRKGVPILPYNEGGAQEHNFRAGTENVAGIVGMATALKKNCMGIFQNSKHLFALEERLIQGLESVDYIRNGAMNHIPGNVSLSFKNADGEAILHRMDLMRICISTGAACDSANTQVSHVIKALGVLEDYAKGTIRISLGKDNTVDEVDAVVAALIRIVGDCHKANMD